MSARSLRPLFGPSPMAVLGACGDAAKWGHWMAREIGTQEAVHA